MWSEVRARCSWVDRFCICSTRLAPSSSRMSTTCIHILCSLFYVHIYPCGYYFECLLLWLYYCELYINYLDGSSTQHGRQRGGETIAKTRETLMLHDKTGAHTEATIAASTHLQRTHHQVNLFHLWALHAIILFLIKLTRFAHYISRAHAAY